MNRTAHVMLAAAMFVVMFAATAHAATSVDVRISLGDRYRGGTLEYHSEPAVVLVPRSKVYCVQDDDYDLYRYGRYWYFIEEGRWYRARSWRGPFLYVRSATVPRSVRGVPLKYRHNWNGPPRHAVARGHHKDGRHDRRVEKAHDRRVEKAHDRRVDRAHQRVDDRRAERDEDKDRNEGRKNHKR
jgi:hypothetical protein